MQNSLTTVAVSSLAILAGPAFASGNCFLGAQQTSDFVIVRYPIPHDPVPFPHTDKHILWRVDREYASKESALDFGDPAAAAVGNFIPGGGCDLLWLEHDPEDSAPSRLAATEGFTPTKDSDFAVATEALPPPWVVASADDFDQDGMTDLLWWDPENATARLWLRTAGNGAPHFDEHPVSGGVPPPLGGPVPDNWWHPVATARLGGNGATGVIWYYPQATIKLRFYAALWTGQELRLQYVANLQGLDQPDWTIVAVGDFDHDGFDDLLRRNGNTVEVCFMSGLTVRERKTLIPGGFTDVGSSDWVVVGPR